MPDEYGDRLPNIGDATIAGHYATRYYFRDSGRASAFHDSFKRGAS